MIAVEDRLAVVEAISRALAEDVGTGDVTSLWVLPPELTATGRFLVKEPGVIAGLEVAAEVFRQVDPDVCWRTLIPDGSTVEPGQVVAEVAGRAQ
ncbi:MAG: nicotinate-nucleotide diphosphorylase (carboxylating), partial [Anaerolineae bacterium]|nr:nicotinate-nucleotide diphosphorylase (carboxylating) [Anaerolineae bacterium]